MQLGRENIVSPGYRTPLHNTLQISEPRILHLKVTENKATVQIKGLPTLEFEPDQRLPLDTQPRIIRITRTPRRTILSLIFNRPEGPPVPSPKESVGIDPGIHSLVTAVGNDGAVLQVPGQDDRNHRKTTRRLRRRMQRQRDSALKDGRARWTNQKTQSGRVRRRFRWTGKPSNEYLKCNAQLRRVEQKRCDSLTGIHHRVSSHLAGRYKTVCLEDTKTANLTRPAKGTAENPGANVRQKTGLNRSILSQGWYLFRQKLEYKCRWHGRTFVPVPAQFTSQTCSRCEKTRPGNRTSQSTFRCLNCGYKANADINAAEIIRRQGLALVRADESPEVPP